MHSSSNISNKSIHKRWFFTYKRCSLIPPSLVPHGCWDNDNVGNVLAAPQQLMVILETETRWRTLCSQRSPSLSLRKRKTMMDNPPEFSVWCCLLSALLGLTVASNARLRSCLPSPCLARLGLSSGFAAPFPSCFLHRHHGTRWAGLRKKQNQVLHFGVGSLFSFPWNTPVALMMWVILNSNMARPQGSGLPLCEQT